MFELHLLPMCLAEKSGSEVEIWGTLSSTEPIEVIQLPSCYSLHPEHSHIALATIVQSHITAPFRLST
jgi:hypothetical protein